jgi:hypothetical protein
VPAQVLVDQYQLGKEVVGYPDDGRNGLAAELAEGLDPMQASHHFVCIPQRTRHYRFYQADLNNTSGERIYMKSVDGARMGIGMDQLQRKVDDGRRHGRGFRRRREAIPHPIARFPKDGSNLALALAFPFEAPGLGDLFGVVRGRHGAALANSRVVRTKYTATERGRRPATIQRGPTCLTAEMPATGGRFRFVMCGNRLREFRASRTAYIAF